MSDITDILLSLKFSHKEKKDLKQVLLLIFLKREAGKSLLNHEIKAIYYY